MECFRVGEGFGAASEWGVTVILCWLSSGGTNDMLIVFWEDLVHGSVKISQNTEHDLWV